MLVDDFLKKRKGRVIDWGGQYGHVTALLREEGYQAECYFLDPPANFGEFQRAFEFPSTCGSSGSRTKLPYSDNSALAVVSSGVLEHVREGGTDEADSLREIFRVIQPGGFLFIWNLPRVRGFPELLKRLLGKWHHPYKYTRKTAERLLQKTGFEVVFSDCHEFLPIGARRVASTLGIPPWLTFELDYLLSKIPPLCLFRQHITLVARKPLR
jgi:ubiquinone/menaquinone biosynthesis C-methylase UbiE